VASLASSTLALESLGASRLLQDQLQLGVQEMTYRNSFSVGDRVEKYKGGYVVTGTIIGFGKTKAGAVRYMVEYDVIEGLLHIHSDNDLRLVQSVINGPYWKDTF
jgi:hypothetical protein